jgi:hypothetical protein
MDWGLFFLIGWGLPLSVYVVLQIGALLSVRGPWRIAVATPVPLMALVCGHMAWAYAEESNLWPMMMLMIAPGAALAVALMWLTALMSSRRARNAIVPASICAVSVLAAALSPNGVDLLWSGSWTVITAIALMALGAIASQVARVIHRQGPSPGSRTAQQ